MSSPENTSEFCIELTEKPTEEDRDNIAHWVRKSAHGRAGPSGYGHFALLLRDVESGKVVGGALVEILYGWLYLEHSVYPKIVAASA